MRSVLILICCGFFATAAWSDNESPDESAMRSWVRQLEDSQPEVRDAAEKAIRDAGPRALEFLPAIDDRTGGELKGRLQRIRGHLEKIAMAATSKASRVTLKGEMTLSEALRSIEKQTGNVVIDYRDRLNQQADDKTLQVDITDKPFWAAFDQLADQASISVYPYVGETRKLAIVAASDSATAREGSAVYEGLFRIAPTTLTCERNLRDSNGDLLRMTVELLWEPRVLPILIRQDLQEIEVVTDTGESIGVSQTGRQQVPVQSGVASLDLQIPLQLPSRDSKTIKSFKGQLTALVPGGDVTFEFADLDKAGAQQSRGGLTVVLDNVRRNGGLQQISILVRFAQASESLQSHLDWVENNVVRLIDPDGIVAGEPGYERYLERETEVGFRYIFPVEEKSLKGWKLTYTTPAGVSEIPVAYELKDIPLP